MLNDKNFDKSFFGEFTDTNKNLGYIQKAAQGTIYLKEICDLDHHIQGKITNFLQKESYSINSSSTGKDSFNTNIRFISSTSKDINLEIEKKRLRKDLLYRLNVATLQIPPIKKRREDIPLLIDYFINKKEKNNVNKIKLSDDVYPLLQTIDWPGNITQIKNFIEWLDIFIKSSNKKIDVITTSMLPNDLVNGDNEYVCAGSIIWDYQSNVIPVWGGPNGLVEGGEFTLFAFVNGTTYVADSPSLDADNIYFAYYPVNCRILSREPLF